jgi:hypothetical protein
MGGNLILQDSSDKGSSFALKLPIHRQPNVAEELLGKHHETLAQSLKHG